MNPQGHQTGTGSHERKDADVINLGMIAALLLLTIALSLFACWGVLHALNRDRQVQEPPRTEMMERTIRFPQPQLLKSPGQELHHVQLATETRLQTYGWVDRQAGITHIPIGKAKELLLARGLPEVGAGQTRLQLMQSRPQTSMQPNAPITSPAPEATP
jgi:hypothetical protein